MGVAWDLEAGENVTYSYYDGDVAYDPNYNGSNNPLQVAIKSSK